MHDPTDAPAPAPDVLHVPSVPALAACVTHVGGRLQTATASALDSVCGQEGCKVIINTGDNFVSAATHT